MRCPRSSASLVGLSAHLNRRLAPSSSITRPRFSRDHGQVTFSRPFLSWLKSKPPPKQPLPEILSGDNLFHPLSQSPISSLQKRAEEVKSLAPCPVCIESHQPQKPQQFECPDCGWPTHCTEAHWKEDAQHKVYCGRLKEVNEDEHDLRSGRTMAEFQMPGTQAYEEAVSFANWDVFWYTRGFASMDTERSRRHASKLLTYPITVASLLHENSGFTIRNQRVTPEGLRSFAALRMALHQPPSVEVETEPRPPMRLFILGARAESSLPPHVWEQLSHLFPGASFHLYMIGPQVTLPANSSAQPAPTAKGVYEPPTLKPVSNQSRTRDEQIQFGVPSSTVAVSPTLTITSLRASYSEVHAHFGPHDPYTDAFFAFCPGFGFPSPTSPPDLQIAAPAEWGPVLPLLLETKCPVFVTGFSPTDVERDVRSLENVPGVSGEFDWVVTPGENPFGSEKWEVADFDPRVMVKTNWGVWGIRGKRREVQKEDGY
ncbi:hypothetical protein BOTBODRAFT_155140 [Botryobasidium botryosum FD-172 SS1]|uniref:Uncharacterized protein n=1 Tax=Botryobasidium botryosum (strain FD-172 SS1) TaxID=930990 RepID=A0A067MQR0_BOTB1|nr:hypothetical protein BOTBODRAFT_155140 [Botryobasidium botryosum FD-172 SS1]